jgi:hypothetical protein
VYSTIDLAAGDIQILLDDTAECASPVESLDIPLVLATTWTRVAIPFAGLAATRAAIVSIGVKQVVDVGAFTLYLDDIQAFVGQVYGVLSIRGLSEPDDVELNAASVVKLLDGSYYANDVPSYNRNITINFGPVSVKDNRTHLLTSWNKSVCRIIAQGDEAIVCRTTEKFGNEWLEGLSFAKAFTMSFVEKSARTSMPSSWDSDSVVTSYSGDTVALAGIRYYTGSGAPLDTLGNNGDWYWDTVGLLSYQKHGGAWVGV